MTGYKAILLPLKSWMFLLTLLMLSVIVLSMISRGESTPITGASMGDMISRARPSILRAEVRGEESVRRIINVIWKQIQQLVAVNHRFEIGSTDMNTLAIR